MSNINTNDNGGILSPDHNSNAKTYPENGKPFSKWGRHYDREVQRKIVEDILVGHFTLEQMCEMLSLGRSFVKDWQRSFRPDVYGPPRRTKRGFISTHDTADRQRIRIRSGKDKGLRFTYDERRNIAQAILTGKMTLSEASTKYRIFDSVLKAWCNSSRYGRTTISVAPIVQAQPSAPVSAAEKLMLNPSQTRFVLDLLLSGSPDKAKEAARLFLSK